MLQHIRKILNPESKGKSHFLQQFELKSQSAATDTGADNNHSCSKLLIKDPDSNKQTPLSFMKITDLSLHLLIRLILNLLMVVVTSQNSTSLHDTANAVDPTSVPNTTTCLESRFGSLEEHTEKGVSA